MGNRFTRPACALISALYQQQRRVFEKVAEFFQILRAQSAVDHAMIAAHRDRHPVAEYDLVALVDHRNLGDLADGEDESLRRIDYG